MLSYDNFLSLLYLLIFFIILPCNEMVWLMLYYCSCIKEKNQLRKRLNSSLKFLNLIGMGKLFRERKMMMLSQSLVLPQNTELKKLRNCVMSIISGDLRQIMMVNPIRNGGSLA